MTNALIILIMARSLTDGCAAHSPTAMDAAINGRSLQVSGRKISVIIKIAVKPTGFSRGI
jgi:hypothetical protein